MNLSQYEQQYKQEVINFFDGRTSYDNEQTISRALPLLELVPIKTGQKVLDLATGTGIIAIEAAQIVGSLGQVIGVDFSTGMLAQAQQKIQALGLQNIELIAADVEYLEFPSESFDIILCSTAIAYFRDIPAALKNWYGWLKPGGTVAFSCCSEESCGTPLIIGACAKHGITVSNINETTGTPEKCHNLMAAAGFEDVKIKTQQLGFYRRLEQAQQWNGKWFDPHDNSLSQASPQQIEQAKVDYQQTIASIVTEQGVWYEHLAFFVSGSKNLKKNS